MKMIAGDVTSVMRTHSKHSNGGQTQSLDRVVEAQAPTKTDRVSLSLEAKKTMGFTKAQIKEDPYHLPPKFRLTKEDYRLSAYEEKYFENHKIIGSNHGHKVERTVEDYEAVLRAMENHKYMIAANLKNQGQDKKTTCYIMKPRDVAVSDDQGRNAKVKKRDENFINAVLAPANLDDILKNKDGTYKDASSVKLNKLWGIAFYKNEELARADLERRGKAFKWYYTPSG